MFFMAFAYQFECEVGGGLTHYVLGESSPF